MPRKRTKRIFAVCLSINALHDATSIPLSIIKRGIYEGTPTRLPAYKVGRSVLCNVRDFERWVSTFPAATVRDWNNKVAARDDGGTCHVI